MLWYGAAVDTLIPKVQRVAKELDEIRDELHHKGGPSGTALPVDIELLNSFKTSVDHMRHVLWAYIEAMSKSDDVDRTLQQYRLQRATEMLRQLREHGPLHPENPQANSFLREIQAIADGALDRYAHPKDKD
ncbi:MAG: hypothetical protein LAN37_13065 [Acidobacteriia bacterium]|nr:hypothetical protein [Terriglobia bacterium]